MATEDIEHQTEIRRTGRGVPWWAGILGVLVLVTAVLASRDGDDPADAPPDGTGRPSPTSAPSSPGPRGELPLVHAVADTDRGPRPATTAVGPDRQAVSPGTRFEALQGVPLVTDDRVVVLADGGTVLAGRPASPFAIVALDGPASDLVASNEPGHVWVVAPEDTLDLIDLDGTDPPVRIPLQGDRVLGPASFGVVTVSPGGAVSWRRPSFDATPVVLHGGRTAVDAGGEVVLAERSLGPDVGRGFELWSIVDGTVVADFVEAPSDRPAVVAPDGSIVALPDPFGWTVRDVRTRAELGSLAHRAPGVPVWIGGGRFAVLVDGTVAVSDGTELSPPWPLRALAEQSP